MYFRKKIVKKIYKRDKIINGTHVVVLSIYTNKNIEKINNGKL